MSLQSAGWIKDHKNVPLREGKRKEIKTEGGEEYKKNKAQEFERLSNADADRILMATLYIGEVNSGGKKTHIFHLKLSYLFIYMFRE